MTYRLNTRCSALVDENLILINIRKEKNIEKYD